VSNKQILLQPAIFVVS